MGQPVPASKNPQQTETHLLPDVTVTVAVLVSVAPDPLSTPEAAPPSFWSTPNQGSVPISNVALAGVALMETAPAATQMVCDAEFDAVLVPIATEHHESKFLTVSNVPVHPPSPPSPPPPSPPSLAPPSPPDEEPLLEPELLPLLDPELLPLLDPLLEPELLPLLEPELEPELLPLLDPELPLLVLSLPLSEPELDPPPPLLLPQPPPAPIITATAVTPASPINPDLSIVRIR